MRELTLYEEAMFYSTGFWGPDPDYLVEDGAAFDQFIGDEGQPGTDDYPLLAE